MVEQSKAIVSIGHGNAEYIYKPEDLNLDGKKHRIKDPLKLAGGGGVNFAARLLATGHEVYPIVTIGNDLTGAAIRDELAQIVKNGNRSRNLQNFICSPGMFVPAFCTSDSVVIVQGDMRTVLAGVPKGDLEIVVKFIDDRLNHVNQITKEKLGAIRISHLHDCDDPPGYPLGKYIKQLIRNYKNTSLIYINFGSSQIQLEKEYWSDIFNDVGIFQFDLHEAKRFWGGPDEHISLTEIVDMLQEQKITAIITLSRFGAIGIYGGKEELIFAWPLEFGKIQDPTGAGDAFSAGVVSCLYSQPVFSFWDFDKAIDTGRLWASYACTTDGGAGDCPDDARLAAFSSTIRKSSTETINRRNASQYLKLIDLAFA